MLHPSQSSKWLEQHRADKARCAARALLLLRRLSVDAIGHPAVQSALPEIDAVFAEQRRLNAELADPDLRVLREPAEAPL